MPAITPTRIDRRTTVSISTVATNATTVLSLMGPMNGNTSHTPLIYESPPLSQDPQERVGGQLKRPSGGAQVHAIQAVLNRAFQDGCSQLVLRKVGVEEEAIVANLVPLAPLPPLAHTLVATCTGER